VYGARPLRRFIAREVETRIARALIADAIPDGALIRVDVKGEEIVVSHSDPPSAGEVAA
jgi:ATP-dependent Clp protease ATP-binding subunit ClpB